MAWLFFFTLYLIFIPFFIFFIKKIFVLTYYNSSISFVYEGKDFTLSKIFLQFYFKDYSLTVFEFNIFNNVFSLNVFYDLRVLVILFTLIIVLYFILNFLKKQIPVEFFTPIVFIYLITFCYLNIVIKLIFIIFLVYYVYLPSLYRVVKYLDKITFFEKNILFTHFLIRKILFFLVNGAYLPNYINITESLSLYFIAEPKNKNEKILLWLKLFPVSYIHIFFNILIALFLSFKFGFFKNRYNILDRTDFSITERGKKEITFLDIVYFICFILFTFFLGYNTNIIYLIIIVTIIWLFNILNIICVRYKKEGAIFFNLFESYSIFISFFILELKNEMDKCKDTLNQYDLDLYKGFPFEKRKAIYKSRDN